MDSLDDMPVTKLAQLESAQLRRRLVETDRRSGAYVERDGRTLVSFCCNDYLNLGHDPRVIAAAREALERAGGALGHQGL
jgi:8-amino-7-oxononanoate synthase